MDGHTHPVPESTGISKLVEGSQVFDVWSLYASRRTVLRSGRIYFCASLRPIDLRSSTLLRCLEVGWRDASMWHPLLMDYLPITILLDLKPKVNCFVYTPTLL